MTTRANQPRSRVLALVAAMALVVTACASEAETSAGDFNSPIAEFFEVESFLGGDDDALEAQFAEQIRESEEAVAACMKQEGFEYTPDLEQLPLFDEEIDYNSREYAEKYGFGITTEAFSQQAVGPDLVGYSIGDAEQGAADDPNLEYFETLSVSEQAAYDKALYGLEPTSALSDEEVEALTEDELDELFNDQAFYDDPKNHGCFQKSQTDFGEDVVYEKLYEEFGDELDALYARVEEDERIVEESEKVSACVADKGLSFPSGGLAAYEELYEMYEEELNEIDGYVGFFEEEFEEEAVNDQADDLLTEDPSEGSTDPTIAAEDEPAEEGEFDGEAPTEEDFDEDFIDEAPGDGFEFEEPELSDADKAKLGELQKEEVELALAVFDCGGSGEDNEELYFEVVAEYEQEFIEDNKARLTEIKEAAE